MQYKFLCETFRLSLGSKKSKKYDKRKRSIQNMELFLLYSPLQQSAVTFTKRLTYKPTFKRYSVVITPKEANTWSIYLYLFVIISISIYNFGIYLILVLSICNAIQSADCHVRYFNKLSIYLSYCVPVWGSIYQSNLNRVIILQKTILRLLSKVSFDSHTGVLFNSQTFVYTK